MPSLSARGRRLARWLRSGALSSGAQAPVRVGLVLSGGGLRGASHIGVLQQLVAHRVPLDVIVGSSAGAIVAAYYAAVGLSLDELETDAGRFRGRHLLAHCANVRLRRRLQWLLAGVSGVIPERLDQLARADFDTLHHGVRALGIVCHDTANGRPRYFATGDHGGARLHEVVRASASIPGLFPAMPVRCGGETLLLTDGGVSDCLPVAFARQPPLGATHLIVSDCRWRPSDPPEEGDRLVYIRPRLFETGTLQAPSATLLAAVREGAAAVTDDMLDRLHAWRGLLTPGSPDLAVGGV